MSDVDILTSGLYDGDKLSKITQDGWTLQMSQPEPEDEPFQQFMVQRIYLISPGGEKTYIGKDGACELRALGFSETGSSFIIALSCELIIYSRY